MNVLIGWDIQDITPTRPVELIGQYYQRKSQSVRDPLSVTALAIEQHNGGTTEQAVMVSMDAIAITRDFLEDVRQGIKSRLGTLDPMAVILNTTHIHTGPSWFMPLRWWEPSADTMKPAEIRDFQLERVIQAIVNAWNIRKPGKVGASKAFAPVGFSRRMLYDNGSAIMYGETNRKDFIGVEGGNDPEVQMLFTWDEQDQLSGVIVNLACPAQVMEAEHVVSADFFGELRKRIRTIYGPGVHLLPQIGSAGCQSPRNLPIQASDETNYWKEPGMLSIAGRLEKALAEGYEAARQQVTSQLVFKHTMTKLELPIRRVSAEEYHAACDDVKRIISNWPDATTASRELYATFVEEKDACERNIVRGPFDDKNHDFVQFENAQAVIRRYETMDGEATFSMELHALRLGDNAIVTNPFELFLDFGQMIIARSVGKRTFIVQLACDAGMYLATARAVAAGGYSALIINGFVGPEGGRMLVDASVNAIEQLWEP